jgi:hypothetical protein
LSSIYTDLQDPLIFLVFLSLSFAVDQLLRSYERVESRLIRVSLRFDNRVICLQVSPKQDIRLLRKAATKNFSFSRGNSTRYVVALKFMGRLLRDDIISLDEAGLCHDCELLCDLEILGGSGPHFNSVPIRNLRPLLEEIRLDFDKWIQNENPCYASRFPGDVLEGKQVFWDGFSGSIQYFFKTGKINPCEKYRNMYSSERHTIAVSYVWSASSLFRIAGVELFA